MKIIKRIIFTFTILVCFFAFKVKALAYTYKAATIATDSSVNTILETDNYNDAKNAMLNATSSETVTPVLYRDGNLVNSKYAIAWFNLSYGTVSLYQNAWDTTPYASTATSYGVEAAFIDYDSAYNRAKIMISGFTGYVDMQYITIKPLSNMAGNVVTVYADTAINIRTCASTSCQVVAQTAKGNVYDYSETKNDGTYTWYHISNGWFAALDDSWAKPSTGTKQTLTFYQPWPASSNLIHYFMYGGTTDNAYTNLGPKPSYLSNGVNYYSYDGIYFYSSIYSMLDDYRNNTNGAHAINSTDPYYNYYLFTPSHSKSGYTANDLNNIITNRGYTSNKKDGVVYVDSNFNWTGADRTGISVMYNSGADFINAQNTYTINAFTAFSTALNESASGTSLIAFAKNNLFGMGASDGDPVHLAVSYNSIADSISAYALISSCYNDINDYRYFGGYSGNKGSGMNVLYATDPYWGEKQANGSYINDLSFGLHDYNSSTLGVTKGSNVNVYHTPSASGKVSYVLKNKNFEIPMMILNVYDQVTNSEGTWYKIHTDTSLDANGDPTSAVYQASTSYGYVNAKDLYVKNKQPIINASDVIVPIGGNYNLLTNVTATDPEGEDIHESIDVESTNYNDKVAGTYFVNLVAHDKENFEVHKTINVTVKDNAVPTFTVLKNTVSQYTTVDLKSLVSVTDYDGSSLTNYTYSGTIDMNTVGVYPITYSVTSPSGKTVTQLVNVNVTINEPPVINATDTTIKINNSFDPLSIASATDQEDGNIKVTVTQNDVNTSVLGDYHVTYSATDSANQTTTKQIKVTVTSKTQNNGTFYMDYLKVIDGKLMMKGYATISGMNNTLDNDITYTIIYHNVDTGTEYSVSGNRITNTSDMTRNAVGTDSFNYTYSWFSVDMNTDTIPVGNYYIYIKAEAKDYYAQYLVRNRYQKEETTSYMNTKSVVIKNDYSGNMGCLQFNIRDKEIVKKTAPYNYNQFTIYRAFEWTEDNKIHLYGTAYSYGMDLSNQIKRTLIFENMSTYDTYSYNLGSTNNGSYQVALPYDDNLGKAYAWFDATIDISNLPKGTYVLYIATESNVTDISEFSEKLHRSLDSLNKSVGSNIYTFSVNAQKGNRIELKVE